MESQIMYQISWPTLVNLISEAKKRIKLIVPSIHSEWVMLLAGAHDRGVDIKVCLNNSEKSIREGFGNDNAIQKLLDVKIPVNESKPNRISIISVDDNHFLYFPTSRIFEDPTDEGIINAVVLDPLNSISFLYSLFL